MSLPPRARRSGALLVLVALLAACTSPLPRPAAPSGDAPPPAVDAVSSDAWQADLARFAAEEARTTVPVRPVVFTGSSSVRLWEALDAAFPTVPVLNRGFGGSHVRDAYWHADAMVNRYAPRRVLLYAGENDIDAGRSPAQVLGDVQAFVARVQHAHPGTPVGFIAIKPSPARLGQLPWQREANRLVAAWAATRPDVDYIDVARPMLDAQGRPRDDLYAADRLHLSAAGYALWREVLAPYVR